MPTPLRNPYIGTRPKLVVAIDVGTTSSGVSYALLEPGHPPEIQGVSRFSGQHMVGGDSKIPSMVCYDGDGVVVGVGSEGDPETNPELEEIAGLSVAEWFKLHLHPPRLAKDQGLDLEELHPLPRNKTVVDVFGDILGYLFLQTAQYIQQRQGENLWHSVRDNIDFILSHPNGWEGKQQAEMRRAAVAAGLVENEADALERVSFVTEGEASLHFCLGKIPSEVNNRANDGILVVDCGGGTIDISSYVHTGQSFKETSPAECLLQGSTFVTKRASEFLAEKLQGSEYDNPREIAAMARYFHKSIMTRFRVNQKSYFIKVGRPSNNNPDLDIKAGSIRLDSTEVASFFEPAVEGITEVIEEKYARSSISIKTICLVGGFATSEYLFTRLKEAFEERNIQILRPDGYLSKAVAEGAVSYYLDRLVSARVSRFTFGIEVTRPFDPTDEEHIKRARQAYTAPSGHLRLQGIFSEVLAKGVAVTEETEFRKSYLIEIHPDLFDMCNPIKLRLKCYRGRHGKPPAWLDREPDYFEDNCDIKGDISGLKPSLKLHHSGRRTYYNFQVDVILLFGLTELKAQIAWKEDGIEKRGPASVVYDMTAARKDE